MSLFQIGNKSPGPVVDLQRSMVLTMIVDEYIADVALGQK